MILLHLDRTPHLWPNTITSSSNIKKSLLSFNPHQNALGCIARSEQYAIYGAGFSISYGIKGFLCSNQKPNFGYESFALVSRVYSIVHQEETQNLLHLPLPTPDVVALFVNHLQSLSTNVSKGKGRN